MALKFAVNNSLSAVTSLPTAIPTGSMTLLQTQTASNSSTIDFTSNIDSTYDVYCFKLINFHPSIASKPQVNFSTDGGSNYNVTKTSSTFGAFNNEAGTSGAISYFTGLDLAQGTGFQPLNGTQDLDNDTGCSGYLFLYNPSSSTFVKHYMANINAVSTAYSQQVFTGGYCNTTSPINAVRFNFASGNIDLGDIKFYGIS
tara:strand:+ start:58 stop:657 length:600 start_codon:yes stop_codon:yes gene_type:complete